MHIVGPTLFTATEKGLHLCDYQVKLTIQTDTTIWRGVNSDLPCHFHTVTPFLVTVLLYVCVCASALPKKKNACVCHVSSSPTRSAPFPHGKEMLPRGRLPIPNQLTVSPTGNPPSHKEARYDTTALQAREGARDSIDTESTFVWENP